MNFFSLDTLNNRINNFNCGCIDRPTIKNINSKHISSKKLKTSALDMMVFINFLPLIIGDLIPFNDEVYALLLNLLDIIDILLLFEISHDLIDALELRNTIGDMLSFLKII